MRWGTLRKIALDQDFRQRVFAPRRAHLRGVLNPQLFTECSAAARLTSLEVPTWSTWPTETRVIILCEDDLAAQHFKASMAGHGSDKATAHSYHRVYPTLVSNPSLIVEIGIGSQSERIPSAMGEAGTPGGSLRAWRDLYPGAQVIGADIDHHALIDEPGIRTHWVDQLDGVAVSALADFVEIQSFGLGADIILDDGFHDTRANLTTLKDLWRCVRHGGWYVIEDVDIHRLPEMVTGISALKLEAELAVVDLRIVQARADDILLVLHKPMAAQRARESLDP